MKTDVAERQQSYADRLLLALDKEQRAELFGRLREYVRWLLAAQSDESARTEFEEALARLEAGLKERVNAGELPGLAAKQSRGDWMWQQALELTRSTAVFFTVYKSLGDGVLELFHDDLAAARRTVDEHLRRIEAEQVEQLRRLIGDPVGQKTTGSHE